VIDPKDDMMDHSRCLSHAALLELKRWNTPTIYNGWEQVTAGNAAQDGFNLEPVRDFMEPMGPMVGYAVTVVCEPSNATHKAEADVAAYRRYVASVPGPKIVVVQDLDKPRTVGSYWGEVNANIHRALGCVGTITDGAIRDVDEMTNAGFKALARCLCVGHAHAWPARWNCEVEVFGRQVKPGQLIHADRHGFLVVPDADQEGLLEAARFMDSAECRHLISTARASAGKETEQVLADINRACADFERDVHGRFGPGAAADMSPQENP
jgi:regulator of RNase E activity RraA